MLKDTDCQYFKPCQLGAGAEKREDTVAFSNWGQHFKSYSAAVGADAKVDLKRLDADVAAQLAANILNLVQLGAGAEISASAKEKNRCCSNWC